MSPETGRRLPLPLIVVAVFGSLFLLLFAQENLRPVPTNASRNDDAPTANLADTRPPVAQRTRRTDAPSRPSAALLGQWKFIAPNGDYVADFYFAKAADDRLLLTVLNKDGDIFDQEYGLFNENVRTRYLELKRWFRKERGGETNGESAYARYPIKHEFSEDMGRVDRTNFVVGEWLKGERLEYIGPKQTP